jgi:hypothetical protein
MRQSRPKINITKQNQKILLKKYFEQRAVKK